jgi:hypothetical protein
LRNGCGPGFFRRTGCGASSCARRRGRRSPCDRSDAQCVHDENPGRAA